MAWRKHLEFDVDDVLEGVLVCLSVLSHTLLHLRLADPYCLSIALMPFLRCPEHYLVSSDLADTHTKTEALQN